jgi:hypothetical protein
MGDERTNMLRAGGVYLLPLEYYEEEDIWRVWAELDVLFEVDDKGLIWSHSPYEGFSRFDGRGANELADAILAITSDENLPAAVTTFGQIARHWGVLVDVTVLSEAKAPDMWGMERFEYVIKVNGVLSGPDDTDYQGGDAREIKAYSYATGATGFLAIGGRCLMFLDYSEGGPYLSPERTAYISADGTIAPIPDAAGYTPYANVFGEFGGSTLAEMAEEAARAKAWQARYAGG